MYINSSIISFIETSSIKLPPYSKILDISIVNNMYHIIYSSGEYNSTYYSQPTWKTFNIKSLTGKMLSNVFIDDNYIYYKSIRYQDADFIEYYQIFIEEIKSISEIRDEKLDTIL